MAQGTQVSELLEKALALSAEDRDRLIDQLVASRSKEPAEEGAEAAWDEEIKRRVDDIRSRRVKTIPGERLRSRLNARRRDAQR